MAESNSTAPKSLTDAGEASTPEDVATLYSWANLHGAKYRDFSASRALAREEARQRVEQALAEQRRKEAEEAERRAQEEAQIAARLAAEAAEAARQAEAERLAEIARQAEAERQAVLAAQEAQRQAALQRSWQPAASEGYTGNIPPAFDSGDADGDFDRPPDETAFASPGDPSPQFAPSHAEPPRVPPIPQWPAADPAAPAAASSRQSPQQPLAGPQGTMYTTPATAYREYAASPYAPEPFREPYPASPWLPPETREVASGPAWLSPEMPAKSPVASPSSAVNQPGVAGQAAAARPSPMQSPGPAQPASPQPGSGLYARPFSSQPAGHFDHRGIVAGGVSAEPRYAAQELVPGQNPGAIDDTPLASRERLASRWYALQGVFDPQMAPAQPAPAQPPARVPVVAVFSLAGGVGKTSLVASLGRALSSRGERVLLVDTAAYGLLPFFFGARDQRPGQLRTFNPPGVSADAPIQLVTLDPESRGPDSQPRESETQRRSADPRAAQAGPQTPAPDWLAQEVSRCAGSANRILIDLPTASGATARRVLRLDPLVLVPVLPDMNSVVSVGAIEAFFRNNASQLQASGGKAPMPFYLLNQFDSSLPLHLDVREILREQIGDRLVPIALRRSPSVSEALAEGMTVMDYSPNAVVAEDYANLAGWVRGLSAPVAQRHRGVRWSER